METTAFGNGSSTPDLKAVRIAVTAADGNEEARVVRLGANDEEAVGLLVQRLETALGDTDRRERPSRRHRPCAYGQHPARASDRMSRE